MINLISRIKNLVRARQNAKLFGLKYNRARDFALPSEMYIAGRKHEVRHLNTHGTRADFFVCLIYDDYRLRELSRRGLKSIVDIGANQGFFTLAARAHNHRAEIHCYEPNRRLADILNHNCAVSRTAVFYEAVGKSQGICRLSFSEESNQTTSETIDDEDKNSIPQVPLSKVVERAGGAVSLLKLDCEGAEWDILKSDAMQSVQALTMEYHLTELRPFSHQDALDLVKRTGLTPLHVSKGMNTGTIVAVRHGF